MTMAMTTAHFTIHARITAITASSDDAARIQMIWRRRCGPLSRTAT